ncbi:Lrp/AsnC family transcriptional regulator [Salinispira pacifica]|uniref:Transcriptional regulator, AsnC family n=1 Tax=Salinispira pacifica TaxID=1307761 RepID=V5WEY8_9SPIO|nr:Lrp/AsnC family transcriptional regulator [Salinispira pacifica]AHC14378.1 Transcriptional regulator, AsnC family [Salinispira pacifica]
MDEINRKIVNLLQQDSSITNQQLAEAIGLSPASSLERVRKLERSGVIRGYTALMDRRKLGKHIKAYIFITMRQHNAQLMNRFNQAVADLPEVMECDRLAGEKDYLMKVVCDNIEDFEAFTRERLTTIPGIDRTSSTIVLSTLVERSGVEY